MDSLPMVYPADTQPNPTLILATTNWLLLDHPTMSVPTLPQSRPPTSPTEQGILGPRPQQAFIASDAQYMPTALDQAFNTLTLNPPDQNWYMDTGATGSFFDEMDTTFGGERAKILNGG
ncbi:hypothetical protein Hdeb2414_s0003g00095501 [Helianthus debilis subsp. tardiflorus]